MEKCNKHICRKFLPLKICFVKKLLFLRFYKKENFFSRGDYLNV